MHYAYFVLVPQKEAKTSGEAIGVAGDFLENNNFANSEGGMWSGAKADWYEIGGRWSGIFTEMKLPKDKLKKCYAELKKIGEKHRKIWQETADKLKAGSEEWGKTYPKLQEAEEKEKLACYNRHFPNLKVIPPIARKGTFSFKGSQRCDSDDAIKMSPKIFKEWKKEYGNGGEESSEYTDTENYEEGLVKDLTFADVKNNWVVVVDYHN